MKFSPRKLDCPPGKWWAAEDRLTGQTLAFFMFQGDALEFARVRETAFDIFEVVASE